MEMSSLGIQNTNSSSNPSIEIVSGTRENIGRWNATEHELFLQGLAKHGKDWKAIAAEIPTRSVVQVRTHAQKYFQKASTSNSRPILPAPRIRRRDTVPYHQEDKIESETSTSPEVSDSSPTHLEITKNNHTHIVIEKRIEPTPTVRASRNHDLDIDHELIVHCHGPYTPLSPFEFECNDYHDDLEELANSYSFDSC